MYDRERRLTGRRRGTSPAPGVAGHLSRHPFRKQEEINNVRNAELNTTDVVEGLPGTAMMSASFPAKMLPFRSPTPQVLRRQLRPGRRGGTSAATDVFARRLGHCSFRWWAKH